MKATAKAIIKPGHILDFGAGIGASTIVLKQLFPKSTVYYYDISKPEKAFAKYLAHKAGVDIQFIDSMKRAKGVGLICASEVFEHIENCVEVLRECIAVKPRYFSIANAFRAVALGHFPVFKVDGEAVPNKKIGRIFNGTLRSAGYKQMGIHFWNNRPSVWEKK